MGRKCKVEGCSSDSRRPEDLGVTFHKIPLHVDVRPKWLSLCRIPAEANSTKIIYVCSRHFLSSDFCTFKGSKYMLRQGVLPSVFPWTKYQPPIIQVESPVSVKGDIDAESKSKTNKGESSSNEKLDTESKPSKSKTNKGESSSNEKLDTESKPNKSVSKSNTAKDYSKNKSSSKSDGNKSSSKSDGSKSSGKSDGNKSKHEKQIQNKKLKSKKLSSNGKISISEFSQGSQVEAKDFNGDWHPAEVIEVDSQENEVFIKFKNVLSNQPSEWIPMDSMRLRHLQDGKEEIKTEPTTATTSTAPVTSPAETVPARTTTELFWKNEKVMAMWNGKLFPATVIKVLDEDKYEILFDDGVKSVLKSQQISKLYDSIQSGILDSQLMSPRSHPAPLFAPVIGTKQDRRDRKRKINVAELFNKKRPRSDSALIAKPEISVVHQTHVKSIENENIEKKKVASDIKSDSAVDTNQTDGLSATVKTSTSTPNREGKPNEWSCKWIDGEPVGTPAVIDSRRSVIVTDHRLPPNWQKHFACRQEGSSAGKWDAVLINPEGRKFRSRNEIKTYIEQEHLPYNVEQFDFGLHLKRARSLGLYEVTDPSKLQSSSSSTKTPVMKGASKLEKKSKTESEKIQLKIVFENGGYKCPIEGCGKNFRKENLAQMHIKHYHPEYSKFIGSTPNVADLAYARTVGEPIEDFMPKVRYNQAVPEKKDTPVKTAKLTPKTPTIKTSTVSSPIIGEKVKTSEQPDTTEKNKDAKTEPAPETPKVPKHESEIVRLLNSEPKIKMQEPFKFDSKLTKIDEASTSRTIKADINETSGLKVHLPVTPSSERQPYDHAASKSASELKIKEMHLKNNDPLKRKDESKPTGGIKTLLPVIRLTEMDKKQTPEEKIMSSPFDSQLKIHIPTKSSEKHIKTNKKRVSDSGTPVIKKRKYVRHDYDFVSDFCDTDSRSPDFVPYQPRSKYKRHVDVAETSQEPVVVQQPQQPQQLVTETGEIIKIERMRQEEIINCTCGFMEEDGLMIQCELCLCWQHAYCNNIEREDQVPEKYVCYICQNPLRMRASQKYVHDQDWLKLGTLATASYHSKDEENTNSRFERLRRSHELSGNLKELKQVIHSVKVQIKIAESKDHPKLYLWAKPWKREPIDHNIKQILDYQPPNIKCNDSIKKEQENENTLDNIEFVMKNNLNMSDDTKRNEMDIEESLVANKIIKPELSDEGLLNILEDNSIQNKQNFQDDALKNNTEYPKFDINSLLSTNINSEKEQSLCEPSTSISIVETNMDATNADMIVSNEQTVIETDSVDFTKSENNFSESNKSVDKIQMPSVDSGTEVSDGELMSQALAGALLSSPTAALSLALTQSDLEKIQNSIDNSGGLVEVCVPEPEAPIEPATCRRNLVENISYYLKTLDERMDAIETEIAGLEQESGSVYNERGDGSPCTRETIQMLLRDLSHMRHMAALY